MIVIASRKSPNEVETHPKSDFETNNLAIDTKWSIRVIMSVVNPSINAVVCKRGATGPINKTKERA